MTNLTKLNSLKTTDSLRAMRSLRPMQSLRPIPSLTTAKTYRKALNVINNKEYADSFADVILGNWEGTAQLRNTLDRNNLGFIKNVPLLNKAVGVLALTKNQFIDPVLDKGMEGFIDVGLNTLINASETMDIFANIVKSQMPSAGGRFGLKTLEASLGLGGNERKVYNFDTGTFLGDLVLEVISDPLNWVSFGGKAVMDISVDTLTKSTREITEAAIKQNLRSAASNFDEFISPSSLDDIAEVASKRLAKNLVDDTLPKVTFETISPALKPSTIAEFDDLAKRLPKVSTADIVDRTVSDSLTKIAQKNAKHIRNYKAASQFKDWVKDNIEDNLTKMSYYNLIGPYKIAKKIPIKEFFNTVYNSVIANYKRYINIKPTGDIAKALDVQADAVFTTANNYLLKQIQETQQLLNPLNISVKKAQYAILKFLRTEAKSLFTEAELNEKSIETLLTQLYKDGFNDAQINTLARWFAKELDTDYAKLEPELLQTVIDIFKKDFPEFGKLINVLAQGPFILHKSEMDLLKFSDAAYTIKALEFYNKNKIAAGPVKPTKNVRTYLWLQEKINAATDMHEHNRYAKGLQTVKNRFTPKDEINLELVQRPIPKTDSDFLKSVDNHVINAYKKDTTKLDKLLYLDKVLLSTTIYDDAVENYGLARLPEFIKEVLPTLPYQQRAVIAQVLRDLGITMRNYKYISDVLNTTRLDDAQKFKAITNIIKRTAQDPKFLDVPFINKMTKDASKMAKDKTNLALNNFFKRLKKDDLLDGLENTAKITNLHDLVSRLSRSKTFDAEPVLNYISDILKPTKVNDFIVFDTASNLHRDLKTWTEVLLDEDLKNVKFIIKYIESTEELLNMAYKAKDLNPKDLMKLRELIISWYNQMETVYNYTTAVKQSLLQNYNAILDTSTYKAINEFIDNSTKVIDTLYNTGLSESALNYLEELNGVMHLQLSHRGMFDLIMQHTNLITDNRPKGKFSYQQVMQELVNPNSFARKEAIPKLIKMFENAGYPNYAKELTQLVAQIDMTMALQKLVTSEIYLEGVSKTESNYIINLLFDGLKNSNVKLGEVLDEPKVLDSMLDKIKLNVYKYMHPVEHEHKGKLIIKQDLAQILQLDFSTGGTPNILIKQDVNANAIISYLNDTTEDMLQNKLNAAYKELLQEGWTNKDIKELFIYPEDYKIFLAYLGNSFIEFGQHADYKLILTNAFSHLNLSHKLNEEIMNRVSLLLNDYITEIAKIPLEDFPIYSLYSLDTIKTINRITSNYPKILVELSRPNTMLVEIDTTMEFLDTFAEAVQQGLDVVIRDTEKISAYLKYSDIKTKTYNEILRRSIFDASVESSTYAVKNVLYDDAQLKFNLSRELLKGTNTEYVMLNNRLSSLSTFHLIDTEVMDQLDNPEFVACIKEGLIRTYSRPNALFEMYNPAVYFESLAKEELYYWHLLTTGNLSKSNKRYYMEQLSQLSIQYKIDTNKVTSELFNNLERIVESANYTPDDAFTPVINSMQTMQYGALSEYIDVTFLKTPRSLDTLGEYKTQVSELIKKDVASKDRFFKRMLDFEALDIFKVDTNAKHNMLIERKLALSDAVTRMTPEELAVFIKQNTPGALIYDTRNTLRETTKEGIEQWTSKTDVFNFTDEQLAEVGLKLKRAEDFYVIGIVDPDKVPNIPLNITRFSYDYENEQQLLTEILQDHIEYLNLQDMNIPLDMLVTEALPKDLWKSVCEDDAFKDILDEVQKVYQNSTFFNKSYSKINATIIGGFDALENMQARYAVAGEYVHYSTDIIKNTLAGMVSFINRSNRTKKYISLFFNSDFSLGSSMLNSALRNASDDELDTFFKQGDYKTLILRADKKGEPIVLDYHVSGKKTLENAIKDGAIMVPTDTALAIKQVVNNRQLTYDAWSLYKRLVVPLYKGLYLFTAGFPIRNFFDSVIFKNSMELGFSSALKSDLTAIRMLKFHDEVQKKVLKITGSQTFDKVTLLEVLKEYTEDEQRVYFLVDLFVNSSASSGYSKAFQTYLEQYNKMDDVRRAWEITWNDRILNNETWSPIRKINDVNNQIEQTARLGLFLGSLDAGLTVSDAIKKVNMTHFNYSDKTPFLEFVENIFWFSTFPLNNLNYYLNHGLMENPTLLRTLVDAQTVSWNSNDYSYEELKKTNFLSYHALAGNLRFGNHIFKLSPSLFDMIGLMTDPFGNITDRLNPFISLPFEAMRGEFDLNTLNPASTQANNAKKFIKGNPLPSLFSYIKPEDRIAWLNKNRYNRYTRWTKYPRIKPNRNLMRKYSSKYYARHYRWWHYKKGMTGLNLQQHHMNIIDPR